VTNLADRQPWMRLPITSGAADGDQFPIALVLSAAGLRERAAPYTDVLEVSVTSAVAEVARTLPVHISLSVQAATSFAVWGNVDAAAKCAQSARAPLDLTVAGKLRRAPFTACDADRPPVDHQLPSAADQRRFFASLDTARSESETLQIEYLGSGVYDVNVVVPTHGAFAVALRLGNQRSVALTTANLTGHALCSGNRVGLPGGACGCPPGHEPTDHELVEQVCIKCPAGKHKPDIGDDPCTDMPIEIWPIAVGSSGLGVVLCLFFLLYEYAERRRRRKELELERNFMAVTSHEVRNPLNGTVGWLRFLRDAEELLPEYHNMAVNGLECAEMALDFLQTLAMVYKLQAKQLKPHPVPTSLRDVVSRIALVIRPQMSDGVTFETSAHPLEQLPEVQCDGTLLTHVLLNLCQNAARFTEEGSVSLHATVTPDADCNLVRYVAFAVRDTGKGIPAAIRASLFSRYTSVGGTGIGLYLSNELITALGSKLTVLSPWAASGAPGTSFEFTLRYELSSAAGQSRASNEGAGLIGGSPYPSLVQSSSRNLVERPPSYDTPCAVGAVDTSTKTHAPRAAAAGTESAAVEPAISAPVQPAAPASVEPAASVANADEPAVFGAVQPAPSEPTATEQATGKYRSRRPPKSQLPRNLKALIADDMRVNRMVLREIFVRHLKWQVTDAVSAEEVIRRTVTDGEQYDLIIMDEHFGPTLMLGSTAVPKLRSALSGREVIISCTGNATESSLNNVDIDAIWGKPVPDWRDGTMQRDLKALFEKRRRLTAGSAAAPDVASTLP